MVETNYSIVSKDTVPMTYRKPHGYWLGVLGKLGMDDALRFEFDNVKVAQYTRNSIHGCFRKARLKKQKLNYKLRSTIVRNSNKTRTLFVWKEKLVEGAKEVR